MKKFRLTFKSYYDNKMIGIGDACVSEITVSCHEELAAQTILFFFRVNELKKEIPYILTENISFSEVSSLTFTVRDESWKSLSPTVAALEKYIKMAIEQYRSEVLEKPPAEYIEEI